VSEVSEVSEGREIHERNKRASNERRTAVAQRGEIDRSLTYQLERSTSRGHTGRAPCSGQS